MARKLLAQDVRPNIRLGVCGISHPKTFSLGCFSVPDRWACSPRNHLTSQLFPQPHVGAKRICYAVRYQMSRVMNRGVATTTLHKGRVSTHPRFAPSSQKIFPNKFPHYFFQSCNPIPDRKSILNIFFQGHVICFYRITSRVPS